MIKSARMALVLAAALALLATTARAGLNSTVNEDSATALDVVWGWDPETTDTNNPSLTNWNVSLSVNNSSSPTTVRLQATHAEDAATSSVPTLDLSAAFTASDFGTVVDSNNLIRRNGCDNRFHFVFNRSQEDPAGNSIHLTGSRDCGGPGPGIPEPASLALMGLGALAIFGRRRAKTA